MSEQTVVNETVDAATDGPTVTPDTGIGDLARLLSDERLSSVPVVEDGKLVGMVGQADLIFQEIEDDVEMPHTLPILGGVIFLERMDHWRERFRKAFGTTVGRPDDRASRHDRRPATPCTRPRADDRARRQPAAGGGRRGRAWWG